MFFSANFIIIIIISTALCSPRLSKTAAAVPVTSEGFIIPAQLQQQSNNDPRSSNTTGLNNGIPSINTIPIANSTPASPNDFYYRYPVPGTKYILYILDCTTALPPTALKATFTKGIANIESKIDAGAGADEPDSFRAYQDPILVEWYAATSAGFRCPYSSLLHLWKALRLVLLDRSRRFPAWLYAKECSYRVTWNGIPGEPEMAGRFVIKNVEPTGWVGGDGLGGVLTTGPVGTS